jgi:hypothetical protein
MEDKQAVLNLVHTILASLKTSGPAGRLAFLSTLSPTGTACHARAMVGKTFEYESFPAGFADRIPWSSAPGELEEGLDGEPTVLVDHDLAMVWCPYWFRVKGALSHVGTNCFTLMRGDWGGGERGENGEGEGKVEWKICGMTDTARVPSEEDRRRLG